jgi:hypothetical protein
MGFMEPLIHKKSAIPGILVSGILVVLAQLQISWAQTNYGYEGSSGDFIPKVTVEMDREVIKIEKLRPREDFSSIEIRINPANTTLDKNKSLLQIVWVSEAGRQGRPLPFTGPRYDPRNKAFRDSMTKSRAIKIIDESDKNLFRNKEFSELFMLSVEGKRCRPGKESPGDATLPAPPETAEAKLRIDKESVDFTSSNLRKGVTLNIDNPTGFNQVIGLEFPEDTLFYMISVGRKLEQRRIPEQDWNRITIPPDSGIFVILIPEAESLELARLNGKEIRVNLYENMDISKVIRIPISTSRELRLSGSTDETEPDNGDTGGGLTFIPPNQDTTAMEDQTTPPQYQNDPSPDPAPESDTETDPEPPAPESGPQPEAEPRAQARTGLGLIPWIVIIASIAIAAGVGGYVVFILIPKIQALEDRLAKNEMFLHGSREAIREELELTKEEILKQCLPDYHGDE